VWWDHTIPPGQTWDSFIARGIIEAKAVIVVWSRTSAASDWVKEEASIARNHNKFLPVQIDDAKPPIGFSRIQAAQLRNWDGNQNTPQWQMLTGEIRNVMNGVVSTQPSAPSTATRPTSSWTTLLSGRRMNFLGGAIAGALIGTVLTFAGSMYLSNSETERHTLEDQQRANQFRVQLAEKNDRIKRLGGPLPSALADRSGLPPDLWRAEAGGRLASPLGRPAPWLARRAVRGPEDHFFRICGQFASALTMKPGMSASHFFWMLAS
jgi:hypothetical protein